MVYVGPRQKLIIQHAVREGFFRAATPKDQTSALYASDRGLLRRGADSQTYHPTDAAREEVRKWQEPGTWRTILSGTAISATTTAPTGEKP